MADSPRYLRSSTRPWPWRDGHRPAGLDGHDIDGDGRILHCASPDPDGAWKPHPDEPSLMAPRRADDGPDGGPYYRMFAEGIIDRPRRLHGPDAPPGRRPRPEPQLPGRLGHRRHRRRRLPAVGARGRRRRARHGGPAQHLRLQRLPHVRRRAAATRARRKADGALPPVDVWTWKELGARLTETSGYPVHSVFEDFTWDKDRPDVGRQRRLGVRAPRHLRLDHRVLGRDRPRHRPPAPPPPSGSSGPRVEDELAVLRWSDERCPGRYYVDWYPSTTPSSARWSSAGGTTSLWGNPPTDLLAAEVAPHADFAVFHALAAPELPCASSRRTRSATTRGGAVGVANVGWLPTDVTAVGPQAAARAAARGGARAARAPTCSTARPGASSASSSRARRGSASNGGAHNDGTPDRVLVAFVVRAPAGTRMHRRGPSPPGGT